VEEVANAIRFGISDSGESGLPGRRVLINPIEVFPNPDVSDGVWSVFTSLTSQTLPKKVFKPIKRLTALSHELSFDKFLSEAGLKAHQEMYKIFESAKVRYKDQYENGIKQILKVGGETLNVDLTSGKNTFTSFVEEADPVVIRNEFHFACRIFSKDICKSYVKYLVKQSEEEPTDAIYQAYTLIAALAKSEEVIQYVEEEADKFAQKWFSEFRVDIKALKDDRQEVYRQIKEMSSDPQDIDLIKPRGWLVNSAAIEANGEEKLLPLYLSHLLCNENKEFPTELNQWEHSVVKTEMARVGFIGWYRNPSASNLESLGVAYKEGDKFKILRPDFLFFSENQDGSIAVDIVDPHGTHLSDALPKLKGLAVYAVENEGKFRRVESCALIGNKLRVLDLKDEKVRQAIETADDAKSLFESHSAHDLS